MMINKKEIIIFFVLILIFLNISSVRLFSFEPTTLINKITKKSKKESTTSIGVRGIDNPEDSSLNNARDWLSLEKMERFYINDNDLEEFIIKGNLKKD